LYDFNKPIGIRTVLSADDQNSVGSFGVDDVKLPALRFTVHFRTYTMNTENRYSTIRNFVETVHKNGAAGSQIVNDKPVVNDFLANIDRTAELL